MSCVLAKEFRMVFDIYYVITPVSSYHKAVLRSVTSLTGGVGILQFDNAYSAYHIRVHDQTGELGPYRFHRTVGKNAELEDNLEYDWTDVYNTNLGIEFSGKGVTFVAQVSIESYDTNRLKVDYHYENSLADLDFYLYSNYNINFDLPNPPYYVNSMQIWFSE
ncbi:MAG: hypothetical protein P1Q69_18365 [Candidatus Thorarchaeota archaeon]|nr:hypothetical protein [Candidatus Thorarchaeota archaeon]